MEVENDEGQSLTVETDAETEDLSQLDEDILRIIESVPDKTVRPGRIAGELGISVEDASAELSALLAAVGGGIDGASFRFERIGEATTMVFSFPDDFRKRALRRRRNEDFKELLSKFGVVLVKVLKIVTAFGLIVSLLIVSIAAVLGIIAAMVALSRGGDHRQNTLLNHQLRSLIYSIRQLLWFYAVFGPENEDTGDPFLKEIAYDLWLFFSLCCGNPVGIFLWMRPRRFQGRRSRGWSTLWDRTNSGIAGVTLRNSDGAEIEHSTGSHRGFLSVAVEYLFGPTPFSPRPSDTEKWLLRANAIMSLSQGPSAGVSLKEISPYVDKPPTSLADTAAIVEQGMLVVAHFHGIPCDGQDAKESITEQSFVFPELMAESSHITSRGFHWTEEEDDLSWQALFYLKANTQLCSTSTIPKYLKESRFKLTRLSGTQLGQCLLLGTLNLIGVLWFQQSVATGGVLQVAPGTFIGRFLLRMLLPLLKFYALLFFALPLGRLGLVAVFNTQRNSRNRRRALLSENL